ncbi:MAG: hypothetical protein ACRED9_10030 [Caulobacteraceae bacterium]
MWREFYDDAGTPRREAFSQKLFFVVASSYCDANRIDVTPEAETGNGPVDFKFSNGDFRIIVEIKLSTNSKVVHGYGTQTRVYGDAERAVRSYFVLVDVGSMGRKVGALFRKRQELVSMGAENLPALEIVDATPKRSASKR